MSVVDATFDKLPAALVNAAKTLLGPLASYPNAWLRRATQAIDDTTEGRSLVAKKMASAVAEKMSQDSETLAAAMEIYAPRAITKLVNTAAVISEAIKESQNDNNEVGIDPDVDWLNGFHRYAEDASSERMRNVLGKILAGEIKCPGSFWELYTRLTHVRRYVI